MIKQLLSITTITAFAVFTATAQNAIPNAGLETWTGNDATGWDNLNDIPLGLGAGSCVKATAGADIHGGTAAMILTTKNIVGTIAPGVAATGTIDFNTQQVSGGVAFNLYPDSLTGWFKYAPAPNEIGGNMVGILFNANRDTVAVATYFPAGTVATYSYFKAAFEYRVVVDNVVTEALFVIASSGRTGGVANTKLYVDDLGLVYNPTVGVDEASVDKIAVYPNPVSDNLNVNMAGIQGANVSIFDITGKKVAQHNLTEKLNSVNVASLANGMYVYQVNSNTNGTLKTGKFIVK